MLISLTMGGYIRPRSTVGQARGGDEDPEVQPGASVAAGAGGAGRSAEGEPRRAGVPGHASGAMMGNVVMTQALRNAGVAASGYGFRSSIKDWARLHDVDELLSEFALAHVEGSATVTAYPSNRCVSRTHYDPQSRIQAVTIVAANATASRNWYARRRHEDLHLERGRTQWKG